MRFGQGLVAAAGCLLISGAFADDSAKTSISPQALSERRSQATAAPFVLDVRSPEEYVSGHVPGAVNIPFDQVAGRLAEIFGSVTDTSLVLLNESLTSTSPALLLTEG